MPKKWIDVDFRHNQKANRQKRSEDRFFHNKRQDRNSGVFPDKKRKKT